MSFVHGKNAALHFGYVNLTSYLNSIDLAIDGETADTTTFQAAWKTAIAGTVGATIEVGGLYDPGYENTTLVAFFTTLAPSSITYCPSGGWTIGDPARLGWVYDTTYAESVPVGGVIAIKASFLCDGRVSFGQLLHPWGTDTNTTTGADKDDTAASATGWAATLHVSAVSAGSWVVKLQDAETNDWADVTGGAFTAVTGPSGQRLLSAAATTALRQHVRYVATRTGRAASDTITFALAYARN